MDTPSSRTRVKTFTASTTKSLDKKVNAFLDSGNIGVLRIHAATSFGTLMVLVEYEDL